MLRTYLALLGAAQKAYDADGGKKNPDNAADPYMTLLGYFNSLRELGGSRRIVEDEVDTRADGVRQPQAGGPEGGPLRRPDDRLRGRRADVAGPHRTRSPRPSAGWPCRSTRRTGWTSRSPRT